MTFVVESMILVVACPTLLAVLVMLLVVESMIELAESIIPPIKLKERTRKQ